MKKFILLRWVIISFFILVILWLASIVFIYNEIQSGKQTAEISTRAFLFHIYQGDFETSYELLSDSTKKEIPYNKFKADIQYPKGAYTGITNVELPDYVWAFHVFEPLPLFTMTFNGTVNYDDGTTGDINVTFDQNNGDWEILSIWISEDEKRFKKFHNLKNPPKEYQINQGSTAV